MHGSVDEGFRLANINCTFTDAMHVLQRKCVMINKMSLYYGEMNRKMCKI